MKRALTILNIKRSLEKRKKYTIQMPYTQSENTTNTDIRNKEKKKKKVKSIQLKIKKQEPDLQDQYLGFLFSIKFEQFVHLLEKQQ